MDKELVACGQLLSALAKGDRQMKTFEIELSSDTRVSGVRGHTKLTDNPMGWLFERYIEARVKSDGTDVYWSFDLSCPGAGFSVPRPEGSWELDYKIDVYKCGEELASQEFETRYPTNLKDLCEHIEKAFSELVRHKEALSGDLGSRAEGTGRG